MSPFNFNRNSERWIDLSYDTPYL